MSAADPSTLAAIQRVTKRCLAEIDRVCTLLDIRYVDYGGTAIGAVRYQGFIPWDDDIDIAMHKADLQRFVEVAQKELPKGLIVQSPLIDKHLKEPITKVRDLNSFFVEPGDDFSHNYEKGLFVDIFPFIAYPTLSRKLVKKLTLGISRSYSILHKAHHYSLRSFAEFFWFGAKYAVCRSIWTLLCALNRNRDTYISNILHNNGYGIMHRQDSIFPLTEITFEGKRFMAPCNPDAYLQDLYRNYMDIPPVEKRKIHAIFVLETLEEDAYTSCVFAKLKA